MGKAEMAQGGLDMRRSCAFFYQLQVARRCATKVFNGMEEAQALFFVKKINFNKYGRIIL